MTVEGIDPHPEKLTGQKIPQSAYTGRLWDFPFRDVRSAWQPLRRCWQPQLALLQ